MKTVAEHTDMLGGLVEGGNVTHPFPASLLCIPCIMLSLAVTNSNPVACLSCSVFIIWTSHCLPVVGVGSLFSSGFPSPLSPPFCYPRAVCAPWGSCPPPLPGVWWRGGARRPSCGACCGVRWTRTDCLQNPVGGAGAPWGR